MKNKYLFLLAILFAGVCKSDDQISLDVGLGVGHSSKYSFSETRMVAASIQETLWYAVKDRITLGGYLDNGPNRVGAAYAAGQIGYEVNVGGTVASIFTGPGGITGRDDLLGGNLQFVSDLHLGIQDLDSQYIGVLYRHISSAGISVPNVGRDFIGLEIRF